MPTTVPRNPQLLPMCLEKGKENAGVGEPESGKGAAKERARARERARAKDNALGGWG